MDDLTKQVLYGVALPLVAAPVIGWFGAPRRAPEGHGAPGRDPAAIRLPLVLGACVTGALIGSYGIVDEAWFAMCWVVIAATAVGVVAALLPRRIWATVLIALATGGAALAAGWRLFQPSDPWLLKAVVGLGPAVLYLGLEPAARRMPGPTVPFVLAGAAGMSAVTIVLALSQNIALPAGALAVALLALAVLAIWRRGLLLADGALCVVSAVLVIAPVTARLYMLDDDFPYDAFAVAPASALLLALFAVPVLRARAAAITIALCAAAIAIGGAVWSNLGSASDESSDASLYEMYES